MASLPRALLLDDPAFSRHVPLGHHPERPERLTAARQAVEKAKKDVTFEAIVAREATASELARVHTPQYVEAMAEHHGASRYLDPDTYVSAESITIARQAAGGVLAMVDAVLEGDVRQGVALVRPPGHHARPERAMGFCLFNNVAVAAAHARARGLSRIAVVDFDVHHGNGTQEMFYADPSVLYVSTHEAPLYPGTGHVDETGEREGRGFTVNVPLSAGGGDDVYRGAFERVVLPVLSEYAPELVIVSAGFDAAVRDPLSDMRLESEAFGWMTRELRRIADQSAGGRTLLVLEGGYDLVALEGGLVSAIGGLTGTATDIARDVDHPDVHRAARAARAAWPTLA